MFIRGVIMIFFKRLMCIKEAQLELEQMRTTLLMDIREILRKGVEDGSKIRKPKRRA